MIKVAVVGTNGLAQYIANSIATSTSHQFVILSRRVRETLISDAKTDTIVAKSRTHSQRMAGYAGI